MTSNLTFASLKTLKKVHSHSVLLSFFFWGGGRKKHPCWLIFLPKGWRLRISGLVSFLLGFSANRDVLGGFRSPVWPSAMWISWKICWWMFLHRAYSGWQVWMGACGFQKAIWLNSLKKNKLVKIMQHILMAPSPILAPCSWARSIPPSHARILHLSPGEAMVKPLIFEGSHMVRRSIWFSWPTLATFQCFYQILSWQFFVILCSFLNKDF